MINKIIQKKSLFTLIVLSFICFVLNSCKDKSEDDKHSIDVGIYSGTGSFAPSVSALIQAIEFAGYSTEKFDEAYIYNENLNKYFVIVFPGGDPREYTLALGPIGRSRIQGFVEFGGGFVGLGAGAAIAGIDSGLTIGIGLFGGTANWPVSQIRNYPEYTVTDIILSDADHHISRSLDDQFTSLYRWGPDFQILNGFNTDIIFVYALTNTPSVIAVSHGLGRCVLSGVQLEIEENDGRDSTDFGQELNDPDSEWIILERIIRYCMTEL